MAPRTACLEGQSCSRSRVLSTVEEVKAQGMVDGHGPLHVLSMSTTVAAPTSMSSATVPTTTVTAAVAVAAAIAAGGVAIMIGVG